jgi:starvation-inducible DNA-binding protein
MKPTLGITDTDRNEVALLLNTLLADEYVLTTKTRNAHWNITGAAFYALHTFFESQFESLDLIVDDIAERIRSIGHFSLGSLSDFLKVTNLLEEKDDFSNSNQVIQTLLHDHETIIGTIRRDILPVSESANDAGTADFVTGILEKHEKIAWMLRSSGHFVDATLKSAKMA